MGVGGRCFAEVGRLCCLHASLRCTRATLLLQRALTCTTDRGDLATLAPLQVVTWATSHEHIRNLPRPLPHQYCLTGGQHRVSVKHQLAFAVLEVGFKCVTVPATYSGSTAAYLPPAAASDRLSRTPKVLLSGSVPPRDELLQLPRHL